MPEPDFLALLRRLETVAPTDTATATLEILDRIGDGLPIDDAAADAVRHALNLAKGIALLRVSDARPSNDPAVPARSTAQYVIAMLWAQSAEVRDRAIKLFVQRADSVFAEIRRNGASVVGTIYYIRYGGSEEIKIGYATELSARLAALGTGTPFKIEVMASHPGTLSDEASLHRRFAHLRISANREWFRPGDELLKHIGELAPTRSRP